MYLIIFMSCILLGVLWYKINPEPKYNKLIEYRPNVDRYFALCKAFNPKDKYFIMWKNACLYHFAKYGKIKMRSSYLAKYKKDLYLARENNDDLAIEILAGAVNKKLKDEKYI